MDQSAVAAKSGRGSGYFNYVATSHPATNVTAAVVGHFTSEDEINLVIAKNNVLSLSTLCINGLKCVKESAIFGNIDLLKCVRPIWSSKDLIFTMTSRFDCMLLSVELSADDNTMYDIKTLARGQVKEKGRTESECGVCCSVDPSNQYIALHLYVGDLKIIPISNQVSSGLKPIEISVNSIRIEEDNVISMCFFIQLRRTNNCVHVPRQ